MEKTKKTMYLPLIIQLLLKKSSQLSTSGLYILRLLLFT
eukprot:UN18864